MMTNTSSGDQTEQGVPKNNLPYGWEPSIPSAVDVDGEPWHAFDKGVRFAVYSNGTDVLKVPLTAEQLLENWRSSGDADSTLDSAAEWHLETLKNLREMRTRLMGGMLLPSFLACPMIETTGRVFQRRLTPLGSLLSGSGDGRIRDLIDAGTACIQTGVRWGVLGRFFALPVDFALGPSGGVVMMGLGQLTFDRRTAIAYLARQPWRNEASGLHMLPESVRDYFVSQMERTFTKEYLASEWGRELHSRCAGNHATSRVTAR